MPIQIRRVGEDDIPVLAGMRARQSQTEAFWQARIRGYVAGSYSPQQAMDERACFVAEETGFVVGLVAGHRTLRLGCEGELQWVDVAEGFRGRGVANEMLNTMARWFLEHRAFRVCVNVAPGNGPAVRLYERHGAEWLNEHWMIWEDIRVCRQEADS